MNKVSILLSTFNGERFLRMQLDSLLHQKYTDLKIIVRDDGSSDLTVSIIEEYKNIYPEKIDIARDSLGNIGVLNSFSRLLELAEAEYYFFCDQDDIWLPEKISTMIAQFKNDEPELVFCDSEIVENKISYPTFFKRHTLSAKQISRGLFIGFVPGCMMAFNQKAKKEFLKSKIDVGLHDRNMFLVTYLTGNIYFLDKPLMHYRIHSNNTIGLGKSDKIEILIKDLVRYLFNNEKYRKIKLGGYFELINQLKLKTDIDLLFEKELFDENTLYNLSYIMRKKWYFKHFKPFHKGFFEGVVQIFCI